MWYNRIILWFQVIPCEDFSLYDFILLSTFNKIKSYLPVHTWNSATASFFFKHHYFISAHIDICESQIQAVLPTHRSKLSKNAASLHMFTLQMFISQHSSYFISFQNCVSANFMYYFPFSLKQCNWTIQQIQNIVKG